MPASSWKELYSDFQSGVREFTARLPITESQFMRDITRGISEFQKQTKIIQREKTIDVENEVFPLGDDVSTIILVRDKHGSDLLSQSPEQLSRTMDNRNIGLNDAGRQFSYRITRDPGRYVDTRYNPIRNGWIGFPNSVRYYTRYANNIEIAPFSSDDTEITIRYILNYHPFSSLSSQWAAWQNSDQFLTLFGTTGVPDEFSAWELAFLSFVRYEHYLRVGNALFAEEKKNFDTEVQRAILSKQQHFEQGQSEYNISPLG